MGAGRLLEAEKSASFLVDPPLAVKGIPKVLHILLNYTPWDRRGKSNPFSPENPDLSVARVAISNSRVVVVVSRVE